MNKKFICISLSSRGEVSVLASQRRHNHNKDVCIVIEKVERVHMLCSYEQYELVCGLSCGGPHFHDLTKLSSDEFSLPRIMKDMLDDIRSKFHCASKDESRLYVLGLQVSYVLRHFLNLGAEI